MDIPGYDNNDDDDNSGVYAGGQSALQDAMSQMASYGPVTDSSSGGNGGLIALGAIGVAALASTSSKAGADGARGLQGPPGINGTNGTNGIDGTNGTNGTNGIDGTNGTNGTNGQVLLGHGQVIVDSPEWLLADPNSLVAAVPLLSLPQPLPGMAFRKYELQNENRNGPGGPTADVDAYAAALVQNGFGETSTQMAGQLTAVNIRWNRVLAAPLPPAHCTVTLNWSDYG